ncbi:Hypothetical protein PHPALM_3579 [Phytophthora palmivora]|uniref:Ubiquitin-like protease family profile domain-containing protein n=1 Tax=Phytophthora palmivora TaxID=4796 RepID=A0A2P4YM07_9STRA|nr:Hypothetical protein PHPALM_3579 [Phytophthora palmivora]
MTSTGRRTRSVNTKLKIAYNALGIEDDDISDEDYEVEDEGEEGDASSADESREEIVPKAGKPILFKAFIRNGSRELKEGKLQHLGDNIHPFVIPADLTRSMEAAITTARKEQREPDNLVPSVSQQGIVLDIVASIDPKLWKFCSRYGNASTEFYRVKAKAKSWVEDRKWLERNWSKLDSDVDFFAKETQTWGVTRETVRKRHQTLANEVISKFTNCRLRSAFATRCDKVTIPFEELVGSVCRGWLSDSSIEFCLSEIAASAGGCCVVSSLLWQIGWPATPRDQLGDYKFVVHPVNLNDSHWGIIIIQLELSGGQLHALPHMYEPLINDCYHEEMETIWNGDKQEGLRGFIDRWYKSSNPGGKMNVDPVTWVDAPQQPDSSSCGVLIVAHAHSVVAGNADLHCYNVSKTDVDVMRLRMLWLMLLRSRERRMPKVDAFTASEIDQKLQDQLK